jgi:hypothetical protein
LLVDSAGARTAWAIAGVVYLFAAMLAFVLTSRTQDTAEPRAHRNGEPAGIERLRALMTEVEETRLREQSGSTEVPLARDAEGRSAVDL